MNVLISGFEPLNNEPINLGYEAVKLLPDNILNKNIRKLELPLSFENSSDILTNAIYYFKPEIVISVGESYEHSTIAVERVAINIDDTNIPDNYSVSPIDKIIYENGKNAYFSNLPIKNIIKNLNSQNIPSKISNSAGTSISNHIMYTSLFLNNENRDFKNMNSGFLHVPKSHENNSLFSIEIIKKALEISIEASIKKFSNDIIEKKKNYFFDFNI